MRMGKRIPVDVRLIVPQCNDAPVFVLPDTLLQCVAKFQIGVPVTTVDAAADVITPQSHRNVRLAAWIAVIGKLIVIPPVKCRVQHKYHMFMLLRARQQHFLGDWLFELTVGVEKVNVIERFELLLGFQENFKPQQCRVRPRHGFLKNPVDARVVFLLRQMVDIGKYEILDLTAFQQILFGAFEKSRPQAHVFSRCNVQYSDLFHSAFSLHSTASGRRMLPQSFAFHSRCPLVKVSTIRN